MKSIMGMVFIGLYFFNSLAIANNDESFLDDQSKMELRTYTEISGYYFALLESLETCGYKFGLQTESVETSRIYTQHNYALVNSAKMETKKFLLQRLTQENYSKVSYLLEDKLAIKTVKNNTELNPLVESKMSCQNFMTNLGRGYGDVDVKLKDQLEIIFDRVNANNITPEPRHYDAVTNTSLSHNYEDQQEQAARQKKLDAETSWQKLYRSTHEYVHSLSK